MPSELQKSIKTRDSIYEHGRNYARKMLNNKAEKEINENLKGKKLLLST